MIMNVTTIVRLNSFEEIVDAIYKGLIVNYQITPSCNVTLDTYYNKKVYGKIYDRRIGIDKDGKHWYYDEEEFIRNTCTMYQGR